MPLVALDAVVEVEGALGRRDIALEDLHLLPGAAPERETALEPGELIVAVRLPAEAAASAGHARYLKVRERTSFAFAVVSVAATLELDGSRIRKARLALGGVAAKPWRSRAAEGALEGAPAVAETFARAADLALTDARPSGENAFKIELSRRLIARALQQALEGAPKVMPALPGSPLPTTPGANHVA